MTTPHKHADLIHAFADGKVLQYSDDQEISWQTWMLPFCPRFDDGNVWRIKPDEPKKAVIQHFVFDNGCVLTGVAGSQYIEDAKIGGKHIPELDREVTLPEES